MEKSGMNRAVVAAIGALSGLSQTVNTMFSIDVGEVYALPIISGDSNMKSPNRLSQKGYRKRARWVR